MTTCSECQIEYEDPPYYTFPFVDCDCEDGPHSGNLCPDCAGPDLEPDDPNDARRPLA